MTFGDFPHVGPKDARDLHFAAKKLLVVGVNPMAERKADRLVKKEAEAQQEALGGIETQMVVVNLGSLYWKQLLAWARRVRC